jgi:hypothetical protein
MLEILLKKYMFASDKRSKKDGVGMGMGMGRGKIYFTFYYFSTIPHRL